MRPEDYGLAEKLNDLDPFFWAKALPIFELRSRFRTAEQCFLVLSSPSHKNQIKSMEETNSNFVHLFLFLIPQKFPMNYGILLPIFKPQRIFIFIYLKKKVDKNKLKVYFYRHRQVNTMLEQILDKKTHTFFITFTRSNSIVSTI